MRKPLISLATTLTLLSSTYAQQPSVPDPAPAIAQSSAQDARKEGLQVTWVDNPEFEIRLYRSVPKVLTAVAITAAQATGSWKTDLPPTADGIPPICVEDGNTFYKNKRDMFAKNAPDALKESLKRIENSKLAKLASISLTPIYGVQSIDGFGSNMMVRAEVKTANSADPVIIDVMYESGIHWTGVHNNLDASPKDVMQVTDKLVKSLVSLSII